MYNQYGQVSQPQYGTLPFPTEQYDPTTLNNNLPAGNDIWPNLRVPPNLPQPVYMQAIAQFRTFSQSRIGRSALHTFAYNILSNNHFQNGDFQLWCQRVVDFAEFLLVAQSNPPHVAADKAAEQIYFCMLAVVMGQFPTLNSMVNSGAINELVVWGKTFVDIQNDVNAFQTAGRVPPMNRGFVNPQPMQSFTAGQPYQPRQLPPVSMVHNMAPTRNVMANNAPQHPQGGMNMTMQPIDSSSRGRYDGINEELADWRKNVVSVKTTEIRNEEKPILTRQTVEPTKPTIVEEERVPMSLEEISINPWKFQYLNPNFNPERPFDVIYNPGGVEIRPAHQSGWKHTRNRSTPYGIAYDPARFLLFHVRWPDGLIQEKLIAWGPNMSEMDYLKHEIDDKLRFIKTPISNERVVMDTRKIIDLTPGPSPSVEDVKLQLDDHLNCDKAIAPLRLDQVYVSSSDMEVEINVRNDVMEMLGITDQTAALPPYEYESGNVHPIDVSKECIEELMDMVANTRTFPTIANTLRSLVSKGILPVRYYRFINQRLTKAMNMALSDNLSLPMVTIDDFVEDINDLLVEIDKRYGVGTIDIVNKHTSSFLKRWLKIAVTEENEAEVTVIVDEYINLQTGWRYEDIASLNLKEGAVLLSKLYHPKIYDIVTSILKRRTEEGGMQGRALRLITVDGAYLTVLKGWLVDNAILIKLED